MSDNAKKYCGKRVKATCEDCRYLLIVKVREKGHPDTMKVRVFTDESGAVSQDGLNYMMKELSKNKWKTMSVFHEECWYTFPCDRRQDYVINSSNYMVLVTVIRSCDVVDLKASAISCHEYSSPKTLHEYLGSAKDHVLKDTTQMFVFPI